MKAQKTRHPQQRRAHATVEAILDAVAVVIKRHGVAAVTTNRIAQVAGVSIGSVYQYFSDKRAIFIALHQRHIEQIDRLVEATLVENAHAPLETLMRAMIEALVDAHADDPVLHAKLFSEVPHRAEGTRDFAARLYGAFRLAIGGRADHATVFVVTHMVDALCHAAALQRPAGLSLARAKEETVQAVLAYVSRKYPHDSSLS